MNPNQTGRKDPALSDLEAFENLLGDSLRQEPAPAEPVAPGKVAMSKADHDAMAELTRLVEPPLEFALPEFPDPHAKAAPAPHASGFAPYARAAGTPSLGTPSADNSAHAAAAAVAPAPVEPLVAAAFTPGWPPATQPVHPADVPLPDHVTEESLAAFEEELRRFDTSRLGMAREAQPATPQAGYYAEPVAPSYPPPVSRHQAHEYSGEPTFDPGQVFETGQTPFAPQATLGAPQAAFGAPPEAHLSPQVALPPLVTLPQLMAAGAAAHAAPPPSAYAQAQPYPQPSPLEAMEQRLAAEAAAASYMPEEAPPGRDLRRSRGVFLALGGMALAGLAVLGGVFSFGTFKKSNPSGEIPLIAAKTEPAKEKPADPGGVEIPNQNAQVLSGRDVTKDTGPAKQVVNTTEQPMDLKEVARRESVRIVSPSPFQPGNATPTTEAPQANAIKPDVEARRVTSVRVPVNGEAGAAPAAAAAIAAGGAGIARPATAAPKPEAPKADGAKAEAGKAETRPARNTASVEGDAAKTQAHKQQAAKAKTPATAPAVATATPAVRSPEKLTPDKKAQDKAAADKERSEKTKRTTHAPMSLVDTPGGQAATRSTADNRAGASSSFAIQLASRPTEADARAAATSLGAKYASALGGKPARVIAGDANGKKVFRVRAGGYSREAAAEACESIRAAGGGCFVTRQ